MPRDKRELRNELAQMHGIDFAADFHTLSSGQADALHEKAREVGYRKPANANGSLGRYFFAYLNREKTTETLHVVQGHYGQGWEDLSAALDRKESRDDLKAYRENAPGAYRLIRRRQKIGA